MTRYARRALGPALVLLAQHAVAVALGDIEVRSALGEPLDARIPLGLVEGEAVDASCFTLARADGSEAMPQLIQGTLTVDAAGAPPALRIRSAARLYEPAIALRIRAACSGDPPAERQFVVLLDPRPDTAGVEPLAIVGATLHSRAGDSLQSIAAQVFPNERAPRAQLLAALREMNPQLASNPAAHLPEGTPVTLPDLRELAKAKPRRQAPPRRDPAPPLSLAQVPAKPATSSGEPPAPKAVREPDAVPAPRAARKAKAATAPQAVREPPAAPEPKAAPESRAASASPKAPGPRAPATASSGSAFVLKLSSGEVDMSRSRGIDDRKRQQLRERQLVLDSDDQVAALLSLRNSMKQLESRVADLQLKLAQMPASLAARSEPAAAPTPPTPPPPRLEAPKALPPRIEAPKIESARAAEPSAPAMTEAPKIELAKPEPPAAPPVVEAPKAAAEAPTPAPVVAGKPAQVEAPKPTPAPVAAAAPAPPAASFDWKSLVSNPLLWATILALAAAVLGLLAWRRRSQAQRDYEAEAGDATMIAEPAFDDEQKLIPATDLRTERPAMASDAGLSTRLPENSRELRRRYIEERFPEIANRTLALEDTPSIVKGARLFYEDGALPRAVELLQFAIEDRPAEVRTWLALFEIFRLERLSGEFAELARRFHEQHGNTEYWRKVQYFGREIDPGNPLYKEDAINTLETIGPREARRLAAAGAAVDPIAENWLDAPMDFENEVLANELRQSLMAVAGLTEQDLVPNPMPALRSVEMFTVA